MSFCSCEEILDFHFWNEKLQMDFEGSLCLFCTCISFKYICKQLKYKSLALLREMFRSQTRQMEMNSLFWISVLFSACASSARALTREYIFVNISIPWRNAQIYCREFYRDLATVSSTEEKSSFLLCVSGGGYWIGLKRTGDTWTWSDGEQYSLLNGFSGKPFYNHAGYDCGAVSGFFPTFWVNYKCEDDRMFLCYQFLILVKEKKTWKEALRYCSTHYTGLASVTSESRLRQLKLETAQAETESVWTGLSFIDGTWLWASLEDLGELVSMSSQCPSPPHHCGSLNTRTDAFNVHNCNDKLNFICFWK